MALLCVGPLCADDAVWNKTADGTFDWTNAANWVSGTVPNGAGQSAFLTNDLTGVQTVQLRQNVTLGSLSAGDAVASNKFDMAINNKSGETYALTFDSGSAGALARLVTGSSGTTKLTIGTPVTLRSDLLVSVGGSDTNNHPSLWFAGALTLNGQALVFTNGVIGQPQVLFDSGCDIADGGTLINQSSSSVGVSGPKAFPGRLIANGRALGNNVNTFTFTTGGFTNAAELVANGYLTNGINQVGGALHSGSRTAFTVNPGQRWTRRQITLNGGSLNEIGQTASTNSGNPTNNWQRGLEYVRSDVATVLVNSAFCYIGIDGHASSSGTYFNVGSLLRGPGSTVYLNGPNATNKVFVAANASQHLRGASGAPGSQTVSVIPWVGAFIAGNPANPQTFATVDETGSFRSVTDAEYATVLTNGAGYNAYASSLALTTNATVNALRLGYVGTQNIGTNRTLTIASGGVLFNVNDKSIGVSGNATAGTLDFGGAEGVVWVPGLGTNTIGAKITGSAGLTKAGTGVLTLTGANGYSGTNHVSGGTLRLGDGTYASSAGAGDVQVHVGAVLSVASANAISDSARLTVDQRGQFYGRVQLESGVSETVKYLFLGGDPQPAGTYGSGASTAANKNDQYFLGTGVLVVSRDATLLSRGTLISVK